mmetsp:Transcript_3001/g.9187  ORF Transcript_3001/g.9187 Transcript_3001/m.9187 type:complete len:580 (+) Transcript_3001:135-1874(+)|eukprot:CAMPEP_0198731578 /NCGR_PEP_ID=MMETSP1475-20131203/30765_1 /TAXON_ID= ORGANISM="Unidentified sp., Strain CCMP1999" /NCGR_SAMPLE_ID=MMETSP1475 /ASSEMBLY_ACC=CAM_ASM_001111 /LENGTH=579 /DNA_ID=CAMNT_0044494555 /DNA_START=63 /DNA_END=1802 /DNA_ORIENTATION=+
MRRNEAANANCERYYGEEGYCILGDECEFRHGEDPVVVFSTADIERWEAEEQRAVQCEKERFKLGPKKFQALNFHNMQLNFDFHQKRSVVRQEGASYPTRPVQDHMGKITDAADSVMMPHKAEETSVAVANARASESDANVVKGIEKPSGEDMKAAQNQKEENSAPEVKHGERSDEVSAAPIHVEVPARSSSGIADVTGENGEKAGGAAVSTSEVVKAQNSENENGEDVAGSDRAKERAEAAVIQGQSHQDEEQTQSFPTNSEPERNSTAVNNSSFNQPNSDASAAKSATDEPNANVTDRDAEARAEIALPDTVQNATVDTAETSFEKEAMQVERAHDNLTKDALDIEAVDPNVKAAAEAQRAQEDVTMRPEDDLSGSNGIANENADTEDRTAQAVNDDVDRGPVAKEADFSASGEVSADPSKDDVEMDVSIPTPVEAQPSTAEADSQEDMEGRTSLSADLPTAEGEKNADSNASQQWVDEVNPELPDGVRKDSNGKIKPVVDLRHQCPIPWKTRQAMAERFANILQDQGMQPVEACAYAVHLEKELVVGSSSPLDYRSCAAGRLRRLRTEPLKFLNLP